MFSAWVHRLHVQVIYKEAFNKMITCGFKTLQWEELSDGSTIEVICTPWASNRFTGKHKLWFSAICLCSAVTTIHPQVSLGVRVWVFYIYMYRIYDQDPIWWSTNSSTGASFCHLPGLSAKTLLSGFNSQFVCILITLYQIFASVSSFLKREVAQYHIDCQRIFLFGQR